MVIGKKIKELRTLNDLTQEELANRVELSKGFISQLENDLVEPSITTLNDIVVALGTTLSDFFKEDKNETIVFTKNDYFQKQESGYKINWLVPNAQKNTMEPILVEIEPLASFPEDYPHEGEEFGYVLEGELLLGLDNKFYSVKEGETFYYASNKNHFIKNVKKQICRIIWVSSPPNF